MDIFESMKTVLKYMNQATNADLLKAYMALQDQVYELDRLYRQARDERDRLQATINLSESMDFEGNFYWITCGDGKVGPFCPRCFNADHAASRMLEFKDTDCYGCAICKLLLYKGGSPLPAQLVTTHFGSFIMGDKPARR